MTKVTLTQPMGLVILHLLWVGQSAGLWYSSPEQCGDGHSAWLPPVPCESPPAVVFHLLLLVPVIPLSPENAEKTPITTGTVKTSADKRRCENLCLQITSMLPHDSLPWLPESLYWMHCLLISAGTADVLYSWTPGHILLIKYSLHVQHNHQWILHLTPRTVQH